MTREHCISIFVFRRHASAVEYLFVRRNPERESDWTPLSTAIRPTETMFGAALRRMRECWSAPDPEPWIDLKSCEQWQVGDLDLVNWAVGYGVPRRFETPVPPQGAIARVRWEPLTAAFQILEQKAARQALFRLHVAVADQR